MTSLRVSLRTGCCRGALVRILCLVVFAGGTTAGRGQTQGPPVVDAAAVPFYPALARVARIEGAVRLRVRTDGKRASEVSVVSGHPLLARAAQENVRTWRFRSHSPTAFETTFHYRMLSESECEMDSGSVLLKLPTEIEVTAKGWQTCDPVVERKR